MPKISTLNKPQSSIQPSNGDFLNLCVELIEINYPSSTIRKDNIPIEAFRASGNTLFKILHCNSIPEIVQSVDNDIGTLIKSKSNFSEIIYFTDSKNLENDFVFERIKNSVQKRKISISIWTYPKVSTALMEKKNYKSVKSFMMDNIDAIYSHFHSVEQKMPDIFDDILNYIFTQQLVPFPAETINKSFLRLQSKIPVNFSKDEDRIEVNKSFEKYWYYKELVENYIMNKIDSDPQRISCLIYKIQNSFSELNSKKEITHPVNYPGTFKTLAYSLIPPNKISVSEYETCAFAIVYYFFEMCDFGERFIGEQLSLLETIKERNDTTKQI